MKRRNFLSGVLASPLALKVRFLAFFRKRPVELCGAPILGSFVLGDQRIRHSCVDRQHCNDLWAEFSAFAQREGERGEDDLNRLRAAWSRTIASWKADNEPTTSQPVYCSRPRGHNGPHMLLNPR